MKRLSDYSRVRTAVILVSIVIATSTGRAEQAAPAATYADHRGPRDGRHDRGCRGQ